MCCCFFCVFVSPRNRIRFRLPDTTSRNFVAKYNDAGDNDYEDLFFNVSSANEVGVSLASSSIRVPRRLQRCRMPGELRKILHKNDTHRYYAFSWSAPQPDEPIVGYTVFWCNSSIDSPNHCTKPLDFVHVPAHQLHYSSNNTALSLNFAVAANTAAASSGIVWTRCTAPADSDINKVVVNWKELGSVSVDIEWSISCVDESLSAGYVITYCLVSGEHNDDCLDGLKLNISIPSAFVHSHRLTGLEPYRMYRVVVTAIAAKAPHRAGPPSDPHHFTTIHAAPTRPRRLLARNVTDAMVWLQWDQPERLNGVLQQYLIYYNGDVQKIKKTSGNFTARMLYALRGLTANAVYQIRLVACTSTDRHDKCSEASNLLEVRTEVGRPGVVQFPMQLPNQIEWSPPQQAGGNLDGYELAVVHGDEKRTWRVYVNGTKCTLALELCQAGEQSYSFQVRAVNIRRRDAAGAAAQLYSELNEHLMVDLTTPARSNRNQAVPAAQHLQTTTWATVPHVHTIEVPHAAAHQRVCLEEDSELRHLIRRSDAQNDTFKGDWVVVKNQDCRTTNRAFFVLTLAMLCAVLVFGYLFGVFAFRKLKRMKDIDVELPEGLQDIILEGGGVMGGTSGKGHGGGAGGAGGGTVGANVNHKGGILLGGGGGVIGGGLAGGLGDGVGGHQLDCGRMKNPIALPDDRPFLNAAEQEESLLPLASDRSNSHCDPDCDELHSSSNSSAGSQSQCEDSDSGHDGSSSGRTLLIGAQAEFAKVRHSTTGAINDACVLTLMSNSLHLQYLDFMGTSKFTVQQPVFKPPTVQVVLTADTDATNSYEPEIMNPTMFPGAVSAFATPPNHPPPFAATPAASNGYVMAHEAAMAPRTSTVGAVAPTTMLLPVVEENPVLPDQHKSDITQQLAQPQQPAPAAVALPTSNGYMQWNPITAAALSAAAAAAAASPQPPANERNTGQDYAGKDAAKAVVSGAHLPAQSEAVAAAAAAVVMADKTDISGEFLVVVCRFVCTYIWLYNSQLFRFRISGK